jgi:murein L,D-transpeptidase YcbB/YkuD
MNGASNVSVPLERPVAVFAFYVTVEVQKGAVYFYPDVYSEDAKLARALGR